MLKEWLAPLLEWTGLQFIELIALIILVILLIKYLTE